MKNMHKRKLSFIALFLFVFVLLNNANLLAIDKNPTNQTEVKTEEDKANISSVKSKINRESKVGFEPKSPQTFVQLTNPEPTEPEPIKPTKVQYHAIVISYEYIGYENHPIPTGYYVTYDISKIDEDNWFNSGEIEKNSTLTVFDVDPGYSDGNYKYRVRLCNADGTDVVDDSFTVSYTEFNIDRFGTYQCTLTYTRVETEEPTEPEPTKPPVIQYNAIIISYAFVGYDSEHPIPTEYYVTYDISKVDEDNWFNLGEIEKISTGTIFDVDPGYSDGNYKYRVRLCNADGTDVVEDSFTVSYSDFDIDGNAYRCTVTFTRVETEEPTDPTDPIEDPTDPTEPEEPTDPIEDPTDPIEEPTVPTDPTDPEEPEPTDPIVQPEKEHIFNIKVEYEGFTKDDEIPELYIQYLVAVEGTNDWRVYGELTKLSNDVTITIDAEHSSGYIFDYQICDANGNAIDPNNGKFTVDKLLYSLEGDYFGTVIVKKFVKTEEPTDPVVDPTEPTQKIPEDTTTTISRQQIDDGRVPRTGETKPIVLLLAILVGTVALVIVRGTMKKNYNR